MGATFNSEQLVPDDVTALATTNAKTAVSPKQAQKMFVTVSGADARMLAGTNPTATTGLLLKITTDQPYEFTGYDFIDDARFISTASSTSTIDIQYVLL